MKIKRMIEINMKARDIQLGDIIKFKLSTGEKVEARAARREGNKMTFVFENCLNERHCMNENDSTEGGYLESDMRSWLNTEIINRFPNKILKHMVQDENGDWLRLLSHEEVFGEDWDGKGCKNLQLPYMRDRKNRIASQGNVDEYFSWWLRDVVSAAYFAHVYSNGIADGTSASSELGVRPAFDLTIFNPSGLSQQDVEQEKD